VIHGNELEIEWADLLFLALSDVESVRLDAVLFELRLNERERERRTDQGDVLAQAQEIGNSTDVVFVAVREHNSENVIEAITDRAEIGQDQVDTWLVLLGEQHATVDDQELAVDFERRHVSADFAETADRRYTEGAWLERWRIK